MKKILAVAVMFMVAFSAAAGDFDTKTIQRDDGSVQHVIPVTEQTCDLQNKSNLGNAAIGAGVGYATGRVISGRSRNSGMWGLAGAAAGALIGANTQKSQECRYKTVLKGHKVITISKDSKMKEDFVPYVGPEKVKL